MWVVTTKIVVVLTLYREEYPFFLPTLTDFPSSTQTRRNTRQVDLPIIFHIVPHTLRNTNNYDHETPLLFFSGNEKSCITYFSSLVRLVTVNPKYRLQNTEFSFVILEKTS